jgi:hypothetical protein
MNTPTTGEIRPKFTLNPAVPVLLEAVEYDLMTVCGHVPVNSPLWLIADSARYAVSLALCKIEADNREDYAPQARVTMTGRPL